MTVGGLARWGPPTADVQKQIHHHTCTFFSVSTYQVLYVHKQSLDRPVTYIPSAILKTHYPESISIFTCKWYILQNMQHVAWKNSTEALFPLWSMWVIITSPGGLVETFPSNQSVSHDLGHAHRCISKTKHLLHLNAHSDSLQPTADINRVRQTKVSLSHTQTQLNLLQSKCLCAGLT